MAEKYKILIVDDNPANLELLAAFLLPNGFMVLKASGGKVAIEAAKSERPNAILLDIMMPGMDGLQVCEVLRSDPDFNRVPIIMVTAKDKAADIVQSLEKGADDYIVKPISQKDLIEKLNRLLFKVSIGRLPSQDYFEKMKGRKDSV
jgi:DNA-binding response OmpR family regulator